MNNFTATSQISASDLANLAVTAFEYNDMTASWCGSAKPACPVPTGTGPWYSQAEFWDGPFQIAVTFDGPNDEEGSRASGAVIGAAEVQAGITKMANDYPSHWGDFISDNYDAVTADVWWQCCVLGDIVYG